MPAPIKKCYFGVQRFSLAFCLMVLLAVGCSDNSGGENASADGGSANGGSTSGSAKKVETSSADNSSAETTSKASKSTKPDATKPPKKAPKKIVVSTEPDVNEPEFHDALLAATKDYLHFGMVNSIALPAPVDCGPDVAPAPQPLMSESEHESSHGNKLYFLFAKEIGHYVNHEGKPAPVGQVIVKESWTSSPSHPGARNLINHASGNRINPRAKVGDKTLEIGQRQHFFVMTKLAVDTPKTDQGWVYGVVDADTRKVIGSGKIASCMSCHVEEGTHDRLFGSKHVSLKETIVSEVEVPAAGSSSKEEAPDVGEAPKEKAPKKKVSKQEAPKEKAPKAKPDE